MDRWDWPFTAYARNRSWNALFRFNFNEEDKKNLRETGNMGRVAELNLRGSEYTPCLISIDKNTNELVAARQEHVYIPQEVSGVRLTDEEIRLLKEGQPVKVEGMTSKAGKEFDATLQYSAERRGWSSSSRRTRYSTRSPSGAYHSRLPR